MVVQCAVALSSFYSVDLISQMPFLRRCNLIAPSGHVRDPASVDRAIARLQAAHWQIDQLEVTQQRFLRFAGTDEARAAQINQLADPHYALPELVLAARGGYGAIRLLPLLNYTGLQQRLKHTSTILMGHSDFTVIQMALLAKAGLTTYSGPMLCSHFGAQTTSAFTMDAFEKVFAPSPLTLSVRSPQTQSLQCSGLLWGGNLANIVSLIGTPYLPQIEGGILFIEDINEAPFRLERMLCQLHLAGILGRQQALLIGELGANRPAEQDTSYTLDDMLDYLRNTLSIPILTGLPVGHGPDIATLPVGAHAELVSDTQGFELKIRQHPSVGVAQP